MVEIIPGLMVYQRPCMMREIEMWLLDSRVGNNSVDL